MSFGSMEVNTKLLILDLDETLVHGTETPHDENYHFRTEKYHIYKRPYVNEFLGFCKEHFKVAVWTSSGEEYASNVIEKLFGMEYPLEFVWSRRKCTPSFDHQAYMHEYIKNLRKVKDKGYRLEKVIMVDDTPFKLSKNYGNLVRVQEFLGDPKDNELEMLMKYLLVLKEVENIRCVEKRGWKSTNQA